MSKNECVVIKEQQLRLQTHHQLEKSGAFVSVSVQQFSEKHQDDISNAIKEFIEKLNQIDCQPDQ